MSPNKLFNTDITVSGSVTTVSGVFNSGDFSESLTISGTPVNIDFSSGFRGALIAATSGTDAVSGDAQIVAWDTVAYDTDGFFDPVFGDDTLFVVPAGVNKIRLHSQVHWFNDAVGDRRLILRKNGNGTLNEDPENGQVGFVVAAAATLEAALQPYQQCHTGPISVVEGDTFEMRVRQGSGGNLTTVFGGTWFGIEVVDPTAAQNPAHVSAVSGTFSTSLTVSGVPVLIAGAQESQFVGSNVAFIRDVTLAADASEITFTDLPQNAANLVVHYSLRADPATENTGLRVRFNQDSSASYDTQQNKLTNGVISVAFQGFDQTEGAAGAVLAATATANSFTVGEILVADYTSASKNTTYRGTNYADRDNTTANQQEYFIYGGTYDKTDVVTAFTMFSPSNNFVSGSKVTVYGYTDDVLAATVSQVIAASGTFSDSLTISGVPVATGTGGGAGNITDINAQTGPSVTITGVGNINTTTVGNVITVSGIDTVDLRSKNFLGAMVTRESGSDQNLSGNTTITWHDVQHDTGGFFDAGNNTRLTIPSGLGIKKVRLSALTRIATDGTPDAADYTTLQIFKNTVALDDPRIVYRYTMPAITAVDVSIPVVSPILPVVDGDFFEFIAGSSAPGTSSVSNIRTWFEVEVIERDAPFEMGEFTAASGTFTDSLTVSGSPVLIADAVGPVPGFRGARVFTSSGIDIPNATTVFDGDGGLPFDSVVFDTDGLFDTAHEGRFVIPAGINKVEVTYSTSFPADLDGDRVVFLSKNGSTAGSLRVAPALDGVDTRLYTTTGVLEVVEGDIITPGVRHTAGATLTLAASNSINYNFSIKVLDPVASIANDLATISGSFTQSLTVSGVPVATGTSSSASMSYFVGAMVSTTSGVDIANGEFNVQMNWDTVEFDTDGQGGTSGLVDLDSDNRAFVIPAEHEDAFWVAKCQSRWDSEADSAGRFSTIFGSPNNLARATVLNIPNTAHHQNVTTFPFQAPAGTRIRVAYTQSHSSPVAVIPGGNAETWFSIERVGISGTP